MRILFLGNSQLGCLKGAFDEDDTVLNKHEVYWYVTVGGDGPYLYIEGNKLKIIEDAINPEYPPRASPECSASIPVDYYDVVVISALGYVDGGYCCRSPAQREGLLFSCKPKANDISDRYLSEECYRSIIMNCLRMQPGFVFLSNIRKFFSGQVIVQPFPMISSSIKEHPGWPLNMMYDDPVGAHKFFSEIRNDFVAQACEEARAKLLPYPSIACEDGLFTKAEMMAAPDVLHPIPSYGRLVLQQILDVV